jgi:hypothetical protein
MGAMRRLGSIGLGLACALTMSAVLAQAAPAAKLTLSNHEIALPAGELSLFEIYDHDNVFVRTSVGDIECTKDSYASNGLLATVMTNSKATDELELERTTGALAREVDCYTTPSETIYSLGYADVSLGWRDALKLRANGKATIKPANLFIFTEKYDLGPELECYFTAAQMTGSNTATASRAPLQLEFKHKFKLDKAASSTHCPKTAELEFWLFFTEDEEFGGTIEEQT